MGFGNKDILASRVMDGNSYLNSLDADKIAELEAEVTDYIYQQTGIEPPSEAENAPPILRGIWADIALFKTLKWQNKVPEEEIKRRTILKDDAIKLLEKIASGKIVVKKAGTSVVESDCPVKVIGTKRLKTL